MWLFFTSTRLVFWWLMMQQSRQRCVVDVVCNWQIHYSLDVKKNWTWKMHWLPFCWISQVNSKLKAVPVYLELFLNYRFFFFKDMIMTTFHLIQGSIVAMCSENFKKCSRHTMKFWGIVWYSCSLLNNHIKWSCLAEFQEQDHASTTPLSALILS